MTACLKDANSNDSLRDGGGIGRHAILRGWCREAWEFESPPSHSKRREGGRPSRLFEFLARVASNPTLALLLFAVVAAGGGCSTNDCVDRRDCPAGQACRDGVCEVDFRRGGGGSADGGPRPDSGMVDGGTFVGGTPADGGGVDGGPPDGPDAGFTEAADSRGLLWVGELSDSAGSSFVASGRFVDESGAVFVQRVQTFPTLEGDICTLSVRRQESGVVAGYEGAAIEVRPGSGMGSGTEKAFTLRSRGNGLFTSEDLLPSRLFAGASEVRFEIRASMAADSLLGQVVEVDAPMEVVPITPLPGAVVSLQSVVPFYWVVANPPQPVVVEVYDAEREVVLSCPTPDDGQFSMPPGAAMAFSMEASASPWVVELRRDVEVRAPVRVRRGLRFYVTVRASWGVRYLGR